MRFSKAVVRCRIPILIITLLLLIPCVFGMINTRINYDMLETYKDFGGIRIEDDLLITKDGCRFLGKDRIPYHPKDVEEFMANNK